jgi:hypothetical protein
MSKKSKKNNKKSKKQTRKEKKADRKAGKANFKKLIALSGLTAYGFFLWKMYQLGEMFTDIAGNVLKDSMPKVTEPISNTQKTAN